MDHKLYRMELIKPFSITLRRIEDYSKNNMVTQQDQSDSDIMEIYYQVDSPAPNTQPVNDSDSTEIYEIRIDNTARTMQTHSTRQRQIKTSNIKKEKNKEKNN